MKIVLFQGGEPGTLYSMAEDETEGELEELLEGEVEMLPMGRRFLLAVAARGEEEHRPIRYAVHRLGREAVPVCGDCAVLAVRQDGSVRSADAAALEAAREIVRAVKR